MQIVFSQRRVTVTDVLSFPAVSSAKIESSVNDVPPAKTESFVTDMPPVTTPSITAVNSELFVTSVFSLSASTSSSSMIGFAAKPVITRTRTPLSFLLIWPLALT